MTIRYRSWNTALPLVVICIMMLFAHACTAEEEGFTVRKIGSMVSHTDNILSVTAPEEGVLFVRVSDEYHVYRVFSRDVPAGESQVVWDGCTYNLEKLNTKTYVFDCTLSCSSGKEYTFSFRSPVVNNAQFLQFALPSSDTAYMLSPDEWFLEAKTILDGKLRIELYAAGEEDASWAILKTMHKGRVEHFTFSQLAGKTGPDAGNYTVKVYEDQNPANFYSFPLQILPRAAPEEEIQVTGDIMPAEDADDETLWQAMMSPAVVVDIDYLDHQNIYEEQNEKSRILGTLHGQTQCLSVLEKNDEWARIGAWNHEDASYVEGWVPAGKLKVVHPSGEYGLLLNKKDQTLTVFAEGKRIETLLVSTGRMAENKYLRETSAGCFVTGLHRVDFSMEGSRYDFVIQYDGGNLLHQIPYSSAGVKDYSRGKPYLGAKASHACIRIQDEPGAESGINAYWIWTHIPYHTKLIILDDREEREKEMAVLSGNTPYSGDTGTLITGSSVSVSSEEEYAVISFGGEVIPGDREGSQNARNSFGKAMDQYGTAYPLSGIAALLSGDDLTCVSLACVLKDNAKSADQRKKTTYRGLPEYAAIFTSGSVELVNFVNDHADDYKEAGYESTLSALDGIAVIGKDHLWITEIKGCLFGFGACTEKEYTADYHTIGNDIQKLKDAGCSYIIYLCSWGEEKGTKHTNLQNAMARACERAGADLVIGSHPNGPQGIDYINGMPVVYSLGKLIFGGSAATKAYDALIVRAFFRIGDSKDTPKLQLIPVLCSSSSADKVNDYKPAVADGEDKTRILQGIQADSPYLISISDDQ